MNEAFELLDAESAQSFLATLDARARRGGEALFRGGKVRDIQPIEPGVCYSVIVDDKLPFAVDLDYDEHDGWVGDCSCPKEIDCEHVFAAMRALLAENSAAKVRNLSSGLSQAAEVAGTRAQKKGPEDSGGLARRLMLAHNRPLKPDETKFVKKVISVYNRCKQTRHINYWDFNEMGMQLGGYGWNTVHIWPAFPENEYEFWLYVANAAKQQGATILDFMEPVTELKEIQERLARWQRTREIDRWKSMLGTLSVQGAFERAVAGKIDLRMVIGEKEAHVEWQRPEDGEFQKLKHAQAQQLAREEDAAGAQFVPEAELLWHFFVQRMHMGTAPHFRYTDLGVDEMLRRLLRMSQLEGRIVDIHGRPLARPSEPLRWHLTPASNDQEDYIMRLVQADGTAAPEILAVFEGSPRLYLTPHAVFTGPARHPHILHVSHENRVPAPAMERAAGVNFLRSLGIELPPRVRERVRNLPYRITIRGRLQPAFPGSDAEECAIGVVAEAPDGHQQKWDGYTWQDITPKSRRHVPGEADTIIMYDSAALQQTRLLLEPLGLRPSHYGQGLVIRVSKKFGEVFSAFLKSVPSDFKVELEGELVSFTAADVAGRVKLDVTETEIDWFDLRVVLDISDTTLTPAEIKLLLNGKGGYVRLEGKGWRRLHYDLSDDEDERLARLGLSPRELSAEPQRLHALQLADTAAAKFLPEEQVAQIQRRAEEIKARVSPNVPAGVTAQLRPYQLEGFHFLAYLSANRFGGILADDMGLGKTLQTLTWLVWLQEEKQRAAKNNSEVVRSETSSPQTVHAPSLVVCPKSVMDNWHAEALRFTPGLRVKAWPARELDNLLQGLTEADLHVLNYTQLRALGESLSPVRWHVVILDEGQYIKNPSSQTAQVARSLRAEHRLVLSGTPIENRLLDLWSLMAFTMPGVIGSRAQFARLYDAKGDPLARRRLSSRVRPFLLRRTKAQVAKDLPDKTEEDLFCEIEGEQQTLYRAELKRAQQMLLRIKTQKELAQQQFHFLTSLLRLRQICCHPRLVSAETSAAGAKTEALLEQLEPLMEEGQKVLVFSQFVELLNLILPVLKERNWPVYYLAGDTENRGDLVREFQSAEGAGIFLISLKAGGFGLNLTAASYVVLFDPWWNPAVENQAIDRTHRIGQTNKVVAYRLLIKNSIEEKIRELQKKKKALAEDVLGEEKFAQSLTLEDLHFLFAD